MSNVTTVHVGPYAEWHLTPEQDTLPEELYTLLVDKPPSGAGLTWQDAAPTITIDGVEYVQKIWTPFYYGNSTKHPPRRFSWGWSDDPCAVDLRRPRHSGRDCMVFVGVQAADRRPVMPLRQTAAVSLGNRDEMCLTQ